MHFRIYQDTARLWRWHLKAGNNEIVAHGESYTTKDNCLKAIGLVMATNSSTPIYE